MVDKGHSHSLGTAEIQNQQPEDMIREGYTLRVLDGQEVVVPTAFGAVELPLARMHKPDFSEAVAMDVGVSLSHCSWRLSSHLFPDSYVRSRSLCALHCSLEQAQSCIALL